MDRFHDGDQADKPVSFLTVASFGVEARLVDGEKRYNLALISEDGATVAATFGSAGVAQLAHALCKAAVTACDEDWLTMMMVLITETRSESVDTLFESGHAEGNLPD